MTAGQQALPLGRQLPLAILTDETSRSFRRILRSIEPGRRLTANSIRDLLNAADIPEPARGGLFTKAAAAGLIRVVTVEWDGQRCPVYVKSDGETAHGSRILLYERTAA